MKRILILAAIVGFILIVLSRFHSVAGSSVWLAFLSGLGLGGGIGHAWARTHRSFTDWRGARLSLPRLRRDVVAKAKAFGGVAVAVGLTAAVILALTKGH